MRIGIIGTGIAGMTAAHLLQSRHEVHVFEADDRPGGHANTVTVDLPGGPVAADTGFLVYNERTYPLFTRLLADLGVATHPSEMSFSLTDLRCGLEWRGTSLSTVFAQRRNVARPAFLAMLADVVRFNRLAQSLLAETGGGSGTLADLLAGRRWSAGFLDWYLIPLGSAIWSADPETFTQIPARTFAEFFSRHGLLGPGDQPAWRTVTGGSARYVEAILEPLRKRGRLHLRSEVSKLRRSRAERRAPDSERDPSPSTMWSWPRTATRRWRCWATRRIGSAVCSVPCATRRTGPPSTPIRRYCPPTAGPGRRGTTCVRKGRPAAPR